MWESIDPVAADYTYNSPYNLQENKFGLGVELEGKELSEFFKGVNNAIREDVFPLQPSANRNFESNSYTAGKAVGHVSSLAFGVLEIIAGGTGDAGAAVATVGSGGLASPVTAPLALGSTALIGLGANTAEKALMNLNSEGKYSHLKEPRNVGEGKKTTTSQRQRILEENKLQNAGNLKSDGDGRILDLPQAYKKGEKANMNQAEIDHIKARSKGGTNSNSNLGVLSKEENIKKGNKN